jgi:[ribosomal protein S5]-alanine N-acetyltransferase
MPTLTTARLTLTAVTRDDVDTLHAMWTDADVRRYLWDDVVIDRATAEGVVAQAVRDWEQHRYGLWVILENGQAIGFVGLRSTDDGPELLYGLLPHAWHKGIATEAASAAVRYAFDVAGCETIRAATDPPNVASVRVLERIGMQFDRRGEVGGRDTLFYKRNA